MSSLAKLSASQLEWVNNMTIVGDPSTNVQMNAGSYENSLNLTVYGVAIQRLVGEVVHLRGAIQVIQTNSDNFFLQVNSVFILMMQAGFAFFEAGCVRSKNVINMLLKNILDTFLGGLCYFTVGYALAFGRPATFFSGYGNFFCIGLSPESYNIWFFHFSFCVTAATVVSGSVAERCQFRAYIFYGSVITGITYPVVTHWTWDKVGWLNQIGYQDFAGSGIVHMCGGMCAAIAAIVLGPRLGKYPIQKKGRPEPQSPAMDDVLLGHNIPFMCLGGFMLFVGFFAFNGGSQAGISSALDGQLAGMAMMNTVIAGSAAALSGCFFYRYFRKGNKKYSLQGTISTALAGMVAICAGCNAVDSWGSLAIGVIASFISFTMSENLHRIKLDDPVDAVPVHFGGGLWGVLAAPIFDRNRGILYYWQMDGLRQLGINCIGILAILAWCLVTTLPLFLILHKLGWLRTSVEMEITGMDASKHDEIAYPEQVNCKHCRENNQSNGAAIHSTEQPGWTLKRRRVTPLSNGHPPLAPIQMQLPLTPSFNSSGISPVSKMTTLTDLESDEPVL